MVVTAIVESEGSRSVRSLAREIAGKEHGVPRERATGEPYRNVYNALSQTHLPTLSTVNIVIYDPDRQEVFSGSNLDVAALLVRLTEPVVTLLYKHPDESAIFSETDSQS
jgi:hypothetical protein